MKKSILSVALLSVVTSSVYAFHGGGHVSSTYPLLVDGFTISTTQSTSRANPTQGCSLPKKIDFTQWGIITREICSGEGYHYIDSTFQQSYYGGSYVDIGQAGVKKGVTSRPEEFSFSYSWDTSVDAPYYINIKISHGYVPLPSTLTTRVYLEYDNSTTRTYTQSIGTNTGDQDFSVFYIQKGVLPLVAGLRRIVVSFVLPTSAQKFDIPALAIDAY